jgi:hypothetical protein
MHFTRLLGSKTAPNIDNMMDRLGIDPGFRVVPRFGLLFACALRNCGSCTARQACADWLAQDRDIRLGAPNFYPNADLLSELLCDSSIGRRAACGDARALSSA